MRCVHIQSGQYHANANEKGRDCKALTPTSGIKVDFRLNPVDVKQGSIELCSKRELLGVYSKSHIGQQCEGL